MRLAILLVSLLGLLVLLFETGHGGGVHAIAHGTASGPRRSTLTARLSHRRQPVAVRLEAPRFLPNGASEVALAGATYELGGTDSEGLSGSVLQTTDGRTFTRVAKLPTPVRFAAAATVGDKIYVFGGRLATGQETNEIQEYDVGTERAVVAGYLPRPVSRGAATFYRGRGYLIAGGRLFTIRP
jgi:hypothetical protein